MNLKVLLFLMVFPLAVFSQNKDVNPELLKKPILLYLMNM